MSDDHSKEFRFFVKIILSPNTVHALGKVVYYKRDLPFDLFMKWKWYFEYRAALFRVQNPRCWNEFTFGSYEYVLPEDQYQKRLQNLIRAAKSKLTEYTRKLNNARKNYNQLFPIEDHPNWSKVIKDLDYYKKRLSDLLEEQTKMGV